MNCPLCTREMLADPTYADWACECGLAAPRDVLEELGARLAPAGTLAAAEKVLRERGVSVVKIITDGGVLVWGGNKKTSRHSLAAAVARLEKERT